ncbi:DUF1571 domain-containing protein [Tautonia rosea]|uniref:DUF1571 domain-containing protein n=1 Tax=Tautonia rosea TaxID=2728037 RepID=UPI001472DF53|nr:DUF1571 domain-containing protein [Tautonia rosea]
MTDALHRLITFRQYRKRALALCLAPVALVFVARWMIAAPLDAAGSFASLSEEPADRVAVPLDPSEQPEPLDESSTSWPLDALEGPRAKQLLNRALADLVTRLETLSGYEATIWRHERVNGRWLMEQTLQLKVRHEPVSVYMKDIGRPKGCEIIYVDGLRNGKLITHTGGGLLGMFLPPIEVEPHSSLAMSQSRFPITEAGVLPVARMLLSHVQRALHDLDASVTLDRITDDEGQPLYRSLHHYASASPDRPFARFEVHYDPETLLPRAYSFHDWPDAPGAEPVLGGRYVIETFDPSIVLSDEDFDPTNPGYNFR